MSDEPLFSSSIPVDAVDECAPTERDPSHLGVGTPSRGVALSVLWWLEGEDANERERAARAVDESERARD
jgi:hypothetical protein